MTLKERIFGGGVSGQDNKSAAYRGSIQEWLPVKNIVKGMVVTKDHRFIKVLEILPVNFYLKSPLERQNIIYAFASYLKIAPDNLEFRVVAQKTDMAGYVARMRQFQEGEPNAACREMMEDNILEVSRVAQAEAITHRFFLIFQYEPKMRARGNTIGAIADRLNEEGETAKRYLDLCGLELLEPDYADNAILELFYELINKKTARHVRLPSGVFDMMTEVHGLYQ